MTIETVVPTLVPDASSEASSNFSTGDAGTAGTPRDAQSSRISLQEDPRRRRVQERGRGLLPAQGQQPTEGDLGGRVADGSWGTPGRAFSPFRYRRLSCPFPWGRGGYSPPGGRGRRQSEAAAGGQARLPSPAASARGSTAGATTRAPRGAADQGVPGRSRRRRPGLRSRGDEGGPTARAGGRAASRR